MTRRGRAGRERHGEKEASSPGMFLLFLAYSDLAMLTCMRRVNACHPERARPREPWRTGCREGARERMALVRSGGRKNMSSAGM